LELGKKRKRTTPFCAVADAVASLSRHEIEILIGKWNQRFTAVANICWNWISKSNSNMPFLNSPFESNICVSAE